MNNLDFADRILGITKIKTLYVKGGFGAPATMSNKKRYSTNNNYNRARASKIEKCSYDTFFFDCCGIVKSVLWGFCADPKQVYGGAKYASNGVPDLSEAGFLRVSTNVSKVFKDIPIGACLYMQGHMGVYVGKGLAVEATPKWKDGVQITAVGNIGKVQGFETRTWECWGKIPYIYYDEKPKDEDEMVTDIIVEDADSGQLVTVRGIYKDGRNYLQLNDLNTKGYAVVGWNGKHPVLKKVDKDESDS